MWVRPESGRSAHAWQPGDYEPPLSGEPSKKFPMPGEMGAGMALEGGGSIAGLEKAWGTARGQKEKKTRGESYIHGISPTVVASLLRLRLFLSVPISVALPLSLSISCFFLSTSLRSYSI